MSTFRPSGVVTMTTDLGHKGPYVATMKGVMLARFPDVGIVDLTHDVLVHWPAEAGFWLRRSYRYFPKGTVHIAVVDPGGRAGREVLVIVHEHHAFVVPDNGLLGHLDPERASVHRFDPRKGPSLGLPEPSATFHGRDIFAPIGADLASGKLSPEGVGPRIHEIVPSWLEEAVAGEREVRGAVITTDNFGNLITNIDEELLARFSSPRVEITGKRIPMRSTYAEAGPGEYLALVNAFGVLEIARAEKSAAKGLGIERGAVVIVRDRED
jgi:S-adenosyl-L-methionine hydrolase (adenosine-forming)